MFSLWREQCTSKFLLCNELFISFCVNWQVNFLFIESTFFSSCASLMFIEFWHNYKLGIKGKKTKLKAKLQNL